MMNTTPLLITLVLSSIFIQANCRIPADLDRDESPGADSIEVPEPEPDTIDRKIPVAINLGINYDVNKGIDQMLKIYGMIFKIFVKDPIRCNNNDPITFWKRNGCREKTVGSTNIYNEMFKATKLDCIRNDDARSLMINSNVPAGTRIYVCDDSGPCSKDDWARITVKKQLDAKEVYCVHTFETDYEDAIVKVQKYGRGNLDGKVSSVGAYYP